MTAHPREKKQCRHLHFLKTASRAAIFFVVLHLLTRIFAAFLRFFSWSYIHSPFWRVISFFFSFSFFGWSLPLFQPLAMSAATKKEPLPFIEWLRLTELLLLPPPRVLAFHTYLSLFFPSIRFIFQLQIFLLLMCTVFSSLLHSSPFYLFYMQNFEFRLKKLRSYIWGRGIGLFSALPPEFQKRSKTLYRMHAVANVLLNQKKLKCHIEDNFHTTSSTKHQFEKERKKVAPSSTFSTTVAQNSKKIGRDKSIYFSVRSSIRQSNIIATKTAPLAYIRKQTANH